MATLGRRYGPLAHKEHGQATVELALSITLLLLVFLAAVDIGRAFNSYIGITNASREGARSGVITNNAASIEPAVRREIAGNGLNPALVTVTYIWPGSGWPAIVTVHYRFNLLALGFLPFSSINLRATTIMHIP